MLRRSISSSVADLTSGKATHRIASQARQDLAMPWQDGGSKLRAVRVAPGRLACEPTDDDYLRELAFHVAGHAVVAWALKDWTHIPHVPPGMSEPITITVR
jgi:hypothetical protein